ncbi:MAG: sporulation protein YunB [Clostridia bacterium]|nr:sporulation protein YunB [Clostridia bacterium]
MRLGEKQHIYFRSTGISRRKFSGAFVFLLVVFILLGNLAYFIKIARPLMAELAKNQSRVLAELATHRAISEMFQDARYTDFITVSRLEDGTVSAIQSNTARINQLKAETAMTVSEAISSINETELSIPLGTLTGYEFLSGVGPRLPVQLMPYGNATVNFISSLSAAGINQSLVDVRLTVKTRVGVVLPGVSTVQEIETEIPVVQTVIVGKVPDNYVNIERTGEDFEDDVLNILN